MKRKLLRDEIRSGMHSEFCRSSQGLQRTTAARARCGSSRSLMSRIALQTHHYLSHVAGERLTVL